MLPCPPVLHCRPRQGNDTIIVKRQVKDFGGKKIHNNKTKYFTIEYNWPDYQWLSLDGRYENGFVMPRAFTEIEERIRNFPVRPDDVWIVTYPKETTNIKGYKNKI